MGKIHMEASSTEYQENFPLALHNWMKLLMSAVVQKNHPTQDSSTISTSFFPVKLGE